MSREPADEGAQAFDFLIGTWHVAHQRLRQRLVGADEWQHFDGTASCRAVLGGVSAMAAGLLRRRRTKLGDELDHDLHPNLTDGQLVDLTDALYIARVADAEICGRGQFPRAEPPTPLTLTA